MLMHGARVARPRLPLPQKVASRALVAGRTCLKSTHLVGIDALSFPMVVHLRLVLLRLWLDPSGFPLGAYPLLNTSQASVDLRRHFHLVQLTLKRY